MEIRGTWDWLSGMLRLKDNKNSPSIKACYSDSLVIQI